MSSEIKHFKEKHEFILHLLQIFFISDLRKIAELSYMLCLQPVMMHCFC